MNDFGMDYPTGDEELARRLQARGFQGREWEEFFRRLIAWGHGRLSGQIRSGEIFVICRDRKIKPSLPRAEHRPTLRDYEIRDLSEQTLGEAVIAFPKALGPGGWSPAGGRS